MDNNNRKNWMDDADFEEWEEPADAEDTVELFELAAESGETFYTPAPEDIFVIDAMENFLAENDFTGYPVGFDDMDSLFNDSSDDFSDEEESGHSDLDEDEEEDEAYSEDEEVDEAYSEDEEVHEDDSEDEEVDEAYFEDEEVDEDDSEDEEVDEDDSEDEEVENREEDYFFTIPEHYVDSPDEDEDLSEHDENEENDTYPDDDDEHLRSDFEIKSEWFDDAGEASLRETAVADTSVSDDSVDLFAVANNADDLPPNETHGALYYWAKKKTAAGWVKFGLKCVAVLVLIFVVSGVLYFNGLLNLIDYKAADDFEVYDNLSDTDYQDDEEIVYSSPESYIETTTIEGFTESMIDIPKKDVLNILLIGTDVRGGTYDARGNTDSMILISINTRDKNIKLTSFMRDMYVFIPDRQWARLNVAYAYGGPQLLFDTLKQNFNVDVDLYVRVNFMYFRKIVNHVGGVDIELSEAEAKYMNDTSEKYNTKPVEPGMQHLDGAQALSYARCRKIDSDFNRTKRQRTVILALVQKIKHCSPGELNSLLNVFLPMIQTNMSKMQILGLMVDGTTYLNNEIETMNVPIKNSWRSEMINKRSVICPNFELNKTAIVAHIYSTYHLDVEQTKYQRFSIPNA